jgi:hypothetical protein
MQGGQLLIHLGQAFHHQVEIDGGQFAVGAPLQTRAA